MNKNSRTATAFRPDWRGSVARLTGIALVLLFVACSVFAQAPDAGVNPWRDDQKKVCGMAPDHFTIQLLAASRFEDVNSFRDYHRLGSRAMIFRFTPKGGWPVFTLLYGDFASEELASTAVRKAPASLRGVSPWVRDFGGIQKAIGDCDGEPDVTAPEPESDEALPDGLAVPSASPLSPLDSDHARVCDRIPAHFTIQLISGRKQISLERFILRYRLAQEAVVVENQLGGRPWYSLLYGDFPTREAARKRLAASPAEMQASKPWIRDFGSIQKSLGNCVNAPN